LISVNWKTNQHLPPLPVEAFNARNGANHNPPTTSQMPVNVPVYFIFHAVFCCIQSLVSFQVLSSRGESTGSRVGGRALCSLKGEATLAVHIFTQSHVPDILPPQDNCHLRPAPTRNIGKTIIGNECIIRLLMSEWKEYLRSIRVPPLMFCRKRVSSMPGVYRYKALLRRQPHAASFCSNAIPQGIHTGHRTSIYSQHEFDAPPTRSAVQPSTNHDANL
jgi:hypothetical protein